MSSGVPFIGPHGCYPAWARQPEGRWVFQRTPVTVGGATRGIAEPAAAGVPESNQAIVWVPAKRQPPLFGLLSGGVHPEREEAFNQLGRLALVCYREDCGWALPPGESVRAVVTEPNALPECWLLRCPRCRGTVGPNLTTLHLHQRAIWRRCVNTGYSPLENPGAGALIASAPTLEHPMHWAAERKVSPRELAYLGQQLWPTLHEMLDYCEAWPTSPDRRVHRDLAHKRWLTEPVAVSGEELTAALHARRDERWRSFIKGFLPGDELWKFDSGDNSWVHRAGRSGFALVRDGEVVGVLTEEMN